MRVDVVIDVKVLGVREAFFIVGSPRMAAVDIDVLEPRILNGHAAEAQAGRSVVGG
jgi:hypothetical protein